MIVIVFLQHPKGSLKQIGLFIVLYINISQDEQIFRHVHIQAHYQISSTPEIDWFAQFHSLKIEVRRAPEHDDNIC